MSHHACNGQESDAEVPTWLKELHEIVPFWPDEMPEQRARKAEQRTALVSLITRLLKEETPMGVSQWEAYGKKYGYWAYFTEQFQKDMGLFKSIAKELAGLSAEEAGGLEQARQLGAKILEEREAQAERRGIQKCVEAVEKDFDIAWQGSEDYKNALRSAILTLKSFL